MRGAAAAVLLTLAACGADGRPVPPSEARAAGAGVDVSGSVELGVARRSGG